MKLNKLNIAIGLAIATSLSAVAEETAKVEEEKQEYERIIITGTSKGRILADTPSSVTVIGHEQIAKAGLTSQADALRSIPSIKVEGGGGEVATNLFVRGIPSGGQFQFTPLEYDGLPVYSTFGLNSSAFDVYYRNDVGIDRVEFVSGGVSNLFGPGSVAGIINYVSKTGSDDPENTVQIELAEDGRIRTDFFTSGPLSKDEGLYYALSGFYRYDEGPLDTGLPTDGYQLRGNLKKEFADGSGSVTVYGQMINDSVQFFLPLPLDGGSRSRAIGNDGKEVFSVQTVHAAELSYDSADGRYVSPIRDGVKTEGGSVGIVLQKELNDDGLALDVKAKYSSYEHQFNLFLDGDGISGNIPLTQQEYLDNQGISGTGTYTFADNDQPLPADYLLFGNRLLDRDRPAEDFTFEANLSQDIEIGDFEHTVTGGFFYSRAEAGDYNIISTYLAEFNNVPRLVNLDVTDAGGNVTTYSQNGVVRPGNSYGNRESNVTRQAFYLTDQFENEDWVFDLGVRWERTEGNTRTEGNQLVTVNDDPSLSTALQGNVTGNGKFQYGEVSATEIAVSAAALYRLTDNINVYGYLSRGFFFPQIRSIKFDENGSPQSYDGEIINLGEFGVKYFNNDFSGSASIFWNSLDDRRNVDFQNGPNGSVIENVSIQSTSAQGIELVGSYKLSNNFNIDANFTYQDHEFDEGPADIVGKELRRKPNVTANIALRYDNGLVDAALRHSYYGDAFANDNNTIELDSYSVFNADLGYTWDLDGEQSIRAGLNVFNLFDSDGITEGSPRQAGAQTEGRYFVGRPVMPRRVGITVRYDF